MTHRRAVVVLAAALACWAALPSAAGKRLPSPALVQALVDEVSGESALAYTARISQFDRIQASEGWHDAAAWIKGELEKIGYTDAVIEGWPSNGTTRYFTYQTPIGWRARRAELWQVSPSRQKLTSFDGLPLTLIKHSGSAHVETELVDVGTGIGEASYRDRDVKGKIVLATGAPGEVAREAVARRGAVGMIGWYQPDVRPGYPNMVRYTAFWPTWENRQKVGFGFNVSKNQGAVLKQTLESGQRVVLRADVETEFYETQVETLTVSMPGAEDAAHELLIVGHLCHPTPSANDNASGSGGMLEMARALHRMVKSGAIAPPKRTIRFLWVPEFSGTVPYVKAHLDRTRRTLAAINCDMIGEDLAKTGGTFNITRTPDSVPSSLNDLAVHVAEIVESLGLSSVSGSDNAFAWRAVPYGGGSDHLIFNDGSLRVPALMFGHGDRFHHTSLDTIDKVDASELRRVSVIALGTILYLASAGDGEALDLSVLAARNGIGRLSAAYHDSLSELLAARTAQSWRDARSRVEDAIRHARWREAETVLSALAYARSPETAAAVKARAASFDGLASMFRSDAQQQAETLAKRLGVQPGPLMLTDAEVRLKGVVPARAAGFVCPIDDGFLEEKVGDKAVAAVALSDEARYEALNFVDGRRSITDIARAVSAEYGPVDVEQVARYFRVLEDAGLLQRSVGSGGPVSHER